MKKRSHCEENGKRKSRTKKEEDRVEQTCKAKRRKEPGGDAHL